MPNGQTQQRKPGREFLQRLSEFLPDILRAAGGRTTFGEAQTLGFPELAGVTPSALEEALKRRRSIEEEQREFEFLKKPIQVPKFLREEIPGFPQEVTREQIELLKQIPRPMIQPIPKGDKKTITRDLLTLRNQLRQEIQDPLILTDPQRLSQVQSALQSVNQQLAELGVGKLPKEEKRIKVKIKSTGQTGTILEREFDPKTMDRI